MTKSVRQIISSTFDSKVHTIVECKLVGTIDGEFSLIDRNEVEFSIDRTVPVMLDGLLKSLADAGLRPRGGGFFPYGGNAKIDGVFEKRREFENRCCLVDYETIELDVYRRDRIRLKKSVENGS